MRNKYPGKCYRCGQNVGPGDGHFERIAGGWRVQHAGCAIHFRNKKRDDKMQRLEEQANNATDS